MRLSLLLLLATSASMCGPSPSVAALAVGDASVGTLTADDFDETYGVIADSIPVTHAGGDAVAVLVTSQTMDPFAIVALRGAPVGADAGAAGGAAACVLLDAPHPLDVLVYVSSAGAAPFGDYRVAVLPATQDVIDEHDCSAGATPGGGLGDPHPGLETGGITV